MKRNTIGIGLLLVILLAACGGQPTPVEVDPPTVPTDTITEEQPTEPPTEPVTPTEPPAPTDVPIVVPTATIENIEAVYQQFERGHAIWLADRTDIWVFVQPAVVLPGLTDDAVSSGSQLFLNGGPWYQFDDTFDANVDPDTDPGLVAPESLQQPKGGIGKVWRNNPNIQLALGWALDWELSYTAQLTTYPLGFVQDNSFIQTGTVYSITTLDGSPLYVYPNAGVWSVSP